MQPVAKTRNARVRRIFSKAEYRILYEHGYASDAVSKYARGYTIPWPKRQAEIVAILGRDPWNGRTATSAGRPRLTSKREPIVKEPAPDCQTAKCQPTVSERQIDVSPVDPCVTDAACLAERRRVMRLPNNLSWGSRCSDCKRGRDRQMAGWKPEISPHDSYHNGRNNAEM